MLLTEPLEVAVVIAAQVAAATGPSRTSLPSMFGPRGHRQARRSRRWAGPRPRMATTAPDDEQREHHAVDHRRVPHVPAASARP